MTTFWARRALITMQSLGKIVQRAPAVGAKMWCLFVLFLLTGQKSGFSPRRGDSLNRFISNFAVPTGTWVRLAVQNFTSIGADGWECDFDAVFAVWGRSNYSLGPGTRSRRKVIFYSWNLHSKWHRVSNKQKKLGWTSPKSARTSVADIFHNGRHRCGAKTEIFQICLSYYLLKGHFMLIC